jgi:hypothetical protein
MLLFFIGWILTYSIVLIPNEQSDIHFLGGIDATNYQQVQRTLQINR